jgi:cyclophilin family peptidyl-prolyl cis-trans isomerase
MTERPSALPALILALLLLIASCGDDDGGSSGATITSADYLAFRDQAVACDGEVPDPAREMSFTEPDDVDLGETITATLTTSCGDITVELLPDVAPETVTSFVFLAEHGYFDGTVSHRVYPGFVVQMGDPTATGGGGPGYRIRDELPTGDFTYLAGIVAMANSGANTGGSQFFIMLADVPLPLNYSVFGFVTSGFEVLERVGGIPVGADPDTGELSYPLETLYLETVTIER